MGLPNCVCSFHSGRIPWLRWFLQQKLSGSNSDIALEVQHSHPVQSQCTYINLRSIPPTSSALLNLTLKCDFVFTLRELLQDGRPFSFIVELFGPLCISSTLLGFLCSVLHSTSIATLLIHHVLVFAKILKLFARFLPNWEEDSSIPKSQFVVCTVSNNFIPPSEPAGSFTSFFPFWCCWSLM